MTAEQVLLGIWFVAMVLLGLSLFAIMAMMVRAIFKDWPGNK